MGSFPLTGKVNQIGKDGSDAGIDQDKTVLTGWTAQLTCNYPKNVPVPDGADVDYLDSRTITLLADGSITEDGVTPGISLTAHDPAIFGTPLQWTIKPGPVILVSGKSIRPKPWTFNAPLAGVAATLGSVLPVAAMPLQPAPASVPWGSVSGKPAFVAAGETAAEARAAIGIDVADLDEIDWYATFAALPVTGVADQLYGVRDTGDFYRWTGTTYVWASNRTSSTGITDATATGRAVLTATDPAAARAALGAGTVGEKILAATTVQAVGQVIGPTQPFFRSADWLWKPIQANPVLSPSSASWAATIAAGEHGFNTRDFSVTIVTADQITASTPRFTITPTNAPAWGPNPFAGYSIPIPAGTPIPAGSDGQLAIVDPFSGKVFGLWQAVFSGGVWSCSWGGVATYNGDGTDFIGSTTAVQLARLAGIPLISEFNQAVANNSGLDHALMFASKFAATSFVYPAKKADAVATNPTIPQGTRFQLDPSINVNAIAGITDGEKVIAKTLQTHGGYISDSGGAPLSLIGQLEPGNASYTAAGIAWDYFDLSHIPWASIRFLGSVDGGATVRDISGNLSADAFIPGASAVPSAAGTTVLTVDSTEVTTITGTQAQTIQLPTTGIVAGQRFTIINASTGTVTVISSSGGALAASIGSGHSMTVVALQAAPTAAAHWAIQYLGNLPQRGNAAANTVAQRDGNANLLADRFVPGLLSVTSAGTTTVLTVDSPQNISVTGTSGQTIQLPTTGIIAGDSFWVENTSTGNAAVTSSSGAAIFNVANGDVGVFIALVATPTLATHWQRIYLSQFAFRAAATPSSTAIRDAAANLSASTFVPNFTTTPTAATTTVLTISSSQEQEFTGTTTQIVTLPTTSVPAGFPIVITNRSTGSLQVNASGGGGTRTVYNGQCVMFVSRVATPTAAADWAVRTIPTNSVDQAATAGTIPQRDAFGDVRGAGFIPNFTSVVSAGTTTVLDGSSSQIQEITGTSAHTFTEATTNIPAGYRREYRNRSSQNVQVNASGGGSIVAMSNGYAVVIEANVAAPTLPAHWTVIGYFPMGSGSISTGSAAWSLTLRNGQADVQADAFVASMLTVASAATTTVLTADSAENVDVTGTTTQTFTLPSASVLPGKGFWFWNNSTGAVTVNASDGSLVRTVAAGAWLRVVARQATPTTNTHWAKTT